MNTNDLFTPYIGQPEGDQLEYKSTLAPARTMAQIIAGFANTSGGVLIFGIRELPRNKIEIAGLSEDFNVASIFLKAQRMLEPNLQLESGFFVFNNKRLYGIKVPKSDTPILVENKKYIRQEKLTVDADAASISKINVGSPRFTEFRKLLQEESQTATSPKKRFLTNYGSILNLYESMMPVLFPKELTDLTVNTEGKALTRLLYSSSMDNFELYLSELLHVVYLANPNLLKAREATVKVEDVLRCNDIDEFIQRLAARKASKLKKGSIKDFLKDNHEIKGLDAFTDDQITEIEKALQIRHLYTHRNGIVDESFLEFFSGQFTRNSEHQLSLSEVLDKMTFMIQMVSLIDLKAAKKFQISTSEPE